MSTSLAVNQHYEETGVSLWMPPETVLAEAKKAADALISVISQKKNKVMFNGEQYIEREDWGTVAKFYGCTAKIVETRYVNYDGVKGFEATAVCLDRNQNEISRAESMCLADEANWGEVPTYAWEDELDANGKKIWVEGRGEKKGHFKGKKIQTGTSPKPLFQLKSMAQTRAEAKVLKSVFGYVVVLAGYKPTPAEEMTGHEFDNQQEHREPVSMPRSTQQAAQQTQTTQKAAPAQQQAQAAPQGQQQAENGIEQISGMIETVKEGTKGVIWLIVDKKTLCVPADKIDPQMKVGAKILVEGKKTVRPAITYWLVGQVLTLLPAEGEAQQEEIIEGEIVESEPVVAPGDAALENELKGMFNENPPARGPAEEAERHQQRAPSKPKNGEADKPGTAGFNRGQRLHILITQNQKNVGFTEEHLKKFMSSIGVEHARDLPYPREADAVNPYKIAEQMILGEIDWHEYIND